MCIRDRISAVSSSLKPGLIDVVRSKIRAKRYSLRTEQAYTGWVRRFISSNGWRHPREMGAVEVESFLSRLAGEGAVSASTQNQALSALLFLYREVLKVDLPWMDAVFRAKPQRKLPTVLSVDEVRRLLAMMEGRPWVLSLIHI